MLDVAIVGVAMVVVDESGNGGMVLRVAVVIVIKRLAVVVVFMRVAIVVWL